MTRLRFGRKQWLALACVAALAVAAGAAFAISRDPKICTLIGSTNGVTVELGEQHRRADRVTICVAERCTRLRRRASAIELGIRASGPRRVSVVAVVERRGAPADVRSALVRLERYEPNGPGCGTWWRARVRSDALGAASSDVAGQFIE